jgi:hypothetical protein
MISDSIDLSTRRMTCRRDVMDSPRADGMGVDVPESVGAGMLVCASFWSRRCLSVSSYFINIDENLRATSIEH